MSKDIIFSNFLDGSSSSNTNIYVSLLDGGSSSTSSFLNTISGNSSSERIKERISSLVSKQFPEFVAAEFPLFITFIEYYYRFLEQDYGAHELIQNSLSYADIDSTAPEFVSFFLNQYAKGIPASSLIDKKLLVKKINDLYEAKGSSLSFSLLFQLLYQTTVEVKYPFENVLIASGGKWNQRTTLKIETVTGNPLSIGNRFLTYVLNNVEYTTPVLDVKLLTPTLSEFTLQTDRLAPSYVKNNIVYVYDRDNNVVFSGIIKPNPVSFSILQPGSGFKVGQIFTINNSGGIGTLLKITSVNSTGGITGGRIINYGYGYPTNFTTYLDPALSVSQIGDFSISSTEGTTESLTIYTAGLGVSDYFAENYTIDGTYTGILFNTYSENNVVGLLQTVPQNPSLAILSFTEGTLAKYPGFYQTNQGFISEADIRLEDDLLYQPFAYQTNTDIDIRLFYDVVIGLIHPAGQRLYNNRVLQTSVDVSANVLTSNVFADAIKLEAYDSADVGEFRAMFYSTGFSDETNALSNNIIQTELNKQDVVDGLSDNNFYNLNILINDDIETFDTIGLQQNVISDSVGEQDSISTLSINKHVTDDIEEVTDSGVILAQDYTESYNVYFLDDYVGSKTLF